MEQIFQMTGRKPQSFQYTKKGMLQNVRTTDLLAYYHMHIRSLQRFYKKESIEEKKKSSMKNKQASEGEEEQ